MNISEVHAALKARGIDYKATAKPEKLVETLNEALEAAGEPLVKLTAEKAMKGKSPVKKANTPPPPDPREPTSNGIKVDPPNRVPDYTPPPMNAPVKGRTFPGSGKEYQSLKKEEGKTQTITMLVNVRHDGPLFIKGTAYEVSNEIAEQFIAENWAE